MFHIGILENCYDDFNNYYSKISSARSKLYSIFSDICDIAMTVHLKNGHDGGNISILFFMCSMNLQSSLLSIVLI